MGFRYQEEKAHNNVREFNKPAQQIIFLKFVVLWGKSIQDKV